jgi:hypothetical protein
VWIGERGTRLLKSKRGNEAPRENIKGSLMSCYVMLEFTAKPGTGTDVLEALRVALPETRNKEGYESLEVTVNQDDRDNIAAGDALDFSEALSKIPRLARSQWRREALRGRDSQRGYRPDPSMFRTRNTRQKESRYADLTLASESKVEVAQLGRY